MTDTPVPQTHAAQIPDTTPRKDNGTPLDGGMTTHGAADLIEGLLDTDDHVPGTSNRDREHRDQGGDGGDKGTADDDADPDGDTPPDFDGGDQGNPDQGDQGGDDKKTGDDDADPGQQDGEQITTLSGLAEALETSPEELAGAISHTFKAAGEERTATLAELVEGYQLRADYDRSKGELAKQRQQLDTAQQEGIKAFEAQAAQMADLLNFVEQNVLAQYGEAEMQQLRVNDPSEFAARMYEKDQKLAALNQKRQEATTQYDNFMAEQKRDFMLREGQKLQAEVPDWGRDKLNTAVETIRSLGLSDNEVGNIIDSRMIKGALELHDLRAENAALKARIEKAGAAAETVKKTVPKIAKPGKPTTSSQAARVDRTRVQKLKGNLKKSQNVRDAAALIETMI